MSTFCRRTSLPVRVCFGCTIPKAQGLTLKHLGMHLTEPLFGHGTLYVGLSRTCDPSNVHLCMLKHSKPHERCANIACKQVLQRNAQNDTTTNTPDRTTPANDLTNDPNPSVRATDDEWLGCPGAADNWNEPPHIPELDPAPDWQWCTSNDNESEDQPQPWEDETTDDAFPPEPDFAWDELTLADEQHVASTDPTTCDCVLCDGADLERQLLHVTRK